MLKTMFTLLYGSCEVLGGDSDTETTTEVSIIVKTGKISLSYAEWPDYLPDCIVIEY